MGCIFSGFKIHLFFCVKALAARYGAPSFVRPFTGPPAWHGDSAMCCGFGVEAHAMVKKSVRHGGREFFEVRNRCTARIPPQSPVTSHYHRSGRAMLWWFLASTFRVQSPRLPTREGIGEGMSRNADFGIQGFVLVLRQHTHQAWRRERRVLRCTC